MKITRNELRLGNLLDFEGETCVVREIDSSGAVVLFNNNEEEWIDLFQFSGIPLTEECLLKFGFNKLEFINNRFQKEYGDFYFELVETNKENYFHLKIRNGSFETNFVGLGIFKYTHVLQNIFFALTGEELTLTKTNESL